LTSLLWRRLLPLVSCSPGSDGYNPADAASADDISVLLQIYE
jgi:hypothetical protein